MVRVIEYEQELVYFRCDECDFWGGIDISSSLSDNCAIDIDVHCDVCGAHRVLYVLRCKDPAFAKELNDKLNSIRIRRSSEED